jgi:hypothetical protein
MQRSVPRFSRTPSTTQVNQLSQKVISGRITLDQLLTHVFGGHKVAPVSIDVKTNAKMPIDETFRLSFQLNADVKGNFFLGSTVDLDPEILKNQLLSEAYLMMSIYAIKMKNIHLQTFVRHPENSDKLKRMQQLEKSIVLVEKSLLSDSNDKNRSSLVALAAKLNMSYVDNREIKVKLSNVLSLRRQQLNVTLSGIFAKNHPMDIVDAHILTLSDMLDGHGQLLLNSREEVSIHGKSKTPIDHLIHSLKGISRNLVSTMEGERAYQQIWNERVTSHKGLKSLLLRNGVTPEGIALDLSPKF